MKSLKFIVQSLKLQYTFHKCVSSNYYILASVFCFLFSVFSTKAQQLNYTLNRDYAYGYDNYYNSKENNFQTFVKPYRFVDLKQVKDSTVVFPSLKKMYGQLSKKEKFKLTAYPLLTAGVGIQATPTSRFTNDLAIGANIMGDIGAKFSFNIKALAGKAQYNSFTDSVIDQTNVIPGVGSAYLMNNDPQNKVYAYQYYSGYISFSPNKIFNFQLGKDKHFFGDGYRSLFLSDATAPYPFFKITTNVWKFNYVNLSTVMKDASNSSNLKKDWATKYATFHYLGINVSKRINIGLFESIIWQGTDSVRHRGYDVNYMNPFVFFRPIEYSLGSSDNSAIGLSFKIKMFNKQQLYGQFFLDDFDLKEALQRNGFWQNKEAVQIGFKSFDLFKVKQLYFQTEFNCAKPYTYSHGSVSQSYSHLNQPLAHPLGANFMESVTFVNYRHKRMLFEAKCIYAIYGADSLGKDNGKNIFISYNKHPHDFDNHIAQGIYTNLITTSIRAAYIVVPSMNLKIEAGLIYRVEQTATYTKQTPYIFIGVKTDLCNLYSDY